MVESDVGFAQEIIEGDAVVGGYGNSDTDADGEVVAGNVVGGAERFDQALGKLHRIVGRAVDALDDGEFVAAEAGDCVGRVHDCGEAFGDLLQEGVADQVAEGVIDRFEAIEVEVEKRKSALTFSRLGEALLEAGFEFEAIDESGEGVVGGYLVDRLFGAVARCYVFVG